MRRYLAVAAVGIAALCLAWAGGRMTVPEILAKGECPHQGPAMKFAGAWFFDLYVGGSPKATPLLMNMNADGTTLTCNSPLPDGSMVTTVHGAWKCVGRNKAVGTFLCIVYGLDHTIAYYEKGSYDIALSKDGNLMEEGSMSIGIYSPDQDPLTEEPAWGVVPCTYSARRLEVD